ncbi:phosphoribosylglycinamide formyltransferase-1 [Alkalibacillus filiformis]|uniref:Phosphoribosylglycinamide formyltransferase n=1 Tax=Alkalibacillus filiformis TaxID=200990 RepID=A0ABU0DVH2_9BACI|nr:phosphoribosylglycinamide formyltransferase [Alkalibacillus filiformis]MDQ0352461.1 phosphoribosylglycinamide formyltransferase-1 [Alkalibacillus filiformis]
MKKLAVLASGSGSNFEAIVKQSTGAYEVVLLITDRDDAYALQRATKLGIPTKSISPKNFEDKATYEQAVLDVIRKYGVDWIALAGYMRIVSLTLLKPYEGRIVNVHPSLLPKFPGKDAIAQALDAEVTKTGVTVHYIDEGVDTGPIISQEVVEVTKQDTYETLQQKIRQVEHELFPKTLTKVIREDELVGK